MISTAAKEGSVWRRWDMHIHAPGTKLNNAYGGIDDDTWDSYIEELERSPVEVFGITDYFCGDTYFEATRRYQERFPEGQKIFFLNIEFRLSESISRDGTHPDIHVVFDNDETVTNPDRIGRFLTHLETQALDDASVRVRCADLNGRAQYESATVSLDALLDALRETFGDEKPYLVAFPANNNGLRSTDSQSPRKVSLADRIDRTCDLFFGHESNREFLLQTDRYQQAPSAPKPVVSGSDAHSFEDLDRLNGDVSGFPVTWIKADTTFAGLRQICFEPESRIHIGAEPEVLTRQGQEATKFIKRLYIDQKEGYEEINGQWFKHVELPLNPELTAIIGNKGSGKSALVDIIGLLGESRQEKYFSFLTDDSKSKKFRQRGYAENFVATLTWQSGRTVHKGLHERCDTHKPEAVEYLPQNYFEQLTNEIEIEQFRNEIEEVVFSHVEETEKLGLSSFSELENAKTQQSKDEISVLKRELSELNSAIVELESQSSPQYRSQIQSQIEEKEEELKSLEATKPDEVARPDEETDVQRSLTSRMDGLSELVDLVSASLEEKRSEATELKSKLQTALSLKERLKNLAARTREELAEIDSELDDLGLRAADILDISIDVTLLDRKVQDLNDAICALEAESDHEFTLETDFGGLSTIPSLTAAHAFVSSEIEALKDQLSTPQRRYQAYLERIAAWEKKFAELVGSDDAPKAETLNGLRNRLNYIDVTLAVAIEEKRERRYQTLASIYKSKSQFLEFYRELKRSVGDRLQAVRTEGFDIEIEASFIVDKDFRREFLNLIDQRKKGPFRTNQEAEPVLGEKLRATNWDTLDDVRAFIDSILDRMRGDDLELHDQAYDVKSLYDFLFSLDYLSSRYELRLGDKNLNELSPGEKGLLLLIFYLQLDKKNTPLVIDQPEDNLDNESIFSVLANCIREAKKSRQVVLVTHNPNLAVGADAEQIVYVSLEKSEDYKFSYESGAIENPALNRRIVDVLEGTQPAFVKRRLKYGIN